MPRIMLLIALSLLAACASDGPKAPPPTQATLSIEAEPGLNPAPDGSGAPAWVHVYQLRGSAGFSRADFFSLVEKGQATLAADLVDHDQFVVKPGERLVRVLEPADGVRYIGVVVAYRSLDRSAWRQLIEIPAHQATSWNLKLAPYAVSVRPVTTP
ncbi:type VI secretion system lipoprotein TssJ [Pseudomonas sp. LRF_L74]|uniref:type VI secretion system lipoprotein TssJ n=1 Tax=Pseudomonas sp. LRF_L74 TaxID=3369422 RepID=UPI003F63401F